MHAANTSGHSLYEDSPHTLMAFADNWTGNVPPLFHCFDEYTLNAVFTSPSTDDCARYLRLVLGNLAAWTHGCSILYPSEIFDPPSIVDAISEERCTALHGVPTHFLGVLAEVQRRRDEGQNVATRNLRSV